MGVNRRGMPTIPPRKRHGRETFVDATTVARDCGSVARPGAEQVVALLTVGGTALNDVLAVSQLTDEDFESYG